MNLLKAIQAISGKPEEGEKQTATEKPKSEASPPPPPADNYNAMAEVLARHENISNRVHSRKNR